MSTIEFVDPELREALAQWPLLPLTAESLTRRRADALELLGTDPKPNPPDITTGEIHVESAFGAQMGPISDFETALGLEHHAAHGYSGRSSGLGARPDPIRAASAPPGQAAGRPIAEALPGTQTRLMRSLLVKSRANHRRSPPRPAPASGLAVPDLADTSTAHGRLMLTVPKGAR